MSAILHEQPVQLGDLVVRVTANNPGMMTGPGTNSYVVGKTQLAVIDPGPNDAGHIEALLRLVGDRLKWIVVTHTHRDHSPAAKALAEATGARLLGNILPVNDGFQDESFVPDQSFANDDRLTTDEFTLRVIKTPGHVNNHLCYLVEEDGVLVTGDHIMQGSTVVIIPPHGDMKDYIDSLRRLLAYSIESIAPGHGELITDPHREIQRLIDHRLGREAKVIAALKSLEPASLEFLTPAVYDDVSPALHPIAQHSLLAHLLKLEKEERASQTDGVWRMRSEAL